MDPITKGQKLSFLNPGKISAIFIGSDITSFFIQASGSSLAASNDSGTTKIGIDILLAGMCINFASFTLFISIVVYFDRATHEAYQPAQQERRFTPVIRALYISWLFIMVSPVEYVNEIRCAFRIAEFATGWDGPINTHEAYFYALDATMMIPATAVFVLYFPAKYGVLSNKQLRKEVDEKKQETSNQYGMTP